MTNHRGTSTLYLQDAAATTVLVRRSPAHDRAVYAQLVYLTLTSAAIIALFVNLPRDLSISVFGHAKHIRDVRAVLVFNVMVPALVLPAMFLVETLCVGWEHSSLRDLLGKHSPTLRSDLMLFLLSRNTPLRNFFSACLTLGISLLSADAVRVWLKATFDVDLSLAKLPIPLMVLAYLTVHTFFDYWAHRLQHTRLFWPLHRFHHAAEEFSLVTADRVHPGDLATIFFTAFLFGLFQVSPMVYIGYGLLLSALRFTIHSRIDSDFGWAGRYLILSPGHHRAHHVADEKDSGGNFGLIPLWDVLFGTLRPAAPRSTPIGVDYPYRHGYWIFSDMLRDSRDFVRGFFTRG